MENRAGQAIPDSPFTIPDEQKRAKPGRLHAQAWLDFSSLRTPMSRINQTLGSAEPDEMGTAWCIFIFDPGPKSKWTPDQRTSLCCQGDAILRLFILTGPPAASGAFFKFAPASLLTPAFPGSRAGSTRALP